jgi:hypothetical protein
VLELIALNEFPGAERFTGMGQLPSEALRMFWSHRRPLTPDQLALGSDAWNAFSSDDPRHLAAIFRTGTPALPIMAPAYQLPVVYPWLLGLVIAVFGIGTIVNLIAPGSVRQDYARCGYPAAFAM